MIRPAAAFPLLRVTRPVAAISLLLPGLLLAAVASAGDIRGRVDLLARRGESVNRELATPPPVLVALRSPGVRTTRRGGPLTHERSIRDGRVILTGTPHGKYEVLRAGDTVRITNTDSVPRRLLRFEGIRTTIFGSIESGAGVSWRVEVFGPVELYTDAPGSRPAWLFVAENPFFKEAGADGSFLFDGIPEQHYDVCAWLPGRAVAAKPASVALEGEVTVDLKLP